MSINRQEVARYILLPGIIPRIREMARTPFSFLAVMFAMTFDMAKLLPRYHPYLRPDAYGTFGMLDVLRTARAHLIFDRQHLDQVLIYFAIVAGWITFIVLFVIAAAYGVMTPANAQMATSVPGLMGEIYQYTATPRPEKDVALMLLDRTLGVTGDTSSGSFFGSGVPGMCPGGELGASMGACTPSAFPTPFHQAMHGLLGFYSWAVFCFAALFLMYIVATIVMEVSIKGTPFGARMNSFWTPIRLVAAIGMLVPLAPHNLNSAQYIVLYTAKIGSAFATNGWLYYNQFLKTAMGTDFHNPMGTIPKYTYDPDLGPTITDSSPLAAKLNAPDMGDLVRFLHLVAACEYYYEAISGKSIQNYNIQGYFYRPGETPKAAYKEPEIEGETPKNTASSFVPYQDALTYFKNGNMRIVFGSYDEATKNKTMGGLDPICGEMTIPVTSVENTSTPGTSNPGAKVAQEYYYQYILGLWDKTTYPRQLMDGYARQMVNNYAKVGPSRTCPIDTDDDGIQNASDGGSNLTELGKCDQDPPMTYMQYQVEVFQSIFKVLIDAANLELSKPENFKMENEVLDRGWAGAGIWYQKIAKMNGDYVSAVQQIPYASQAPRAMAMAQKIAAMSQTNKVSKNKIVALSSDQGRNLLPQDEQMAIALDRINQNLKGEGVGYSFFPDPNGTSGVSGNLGYPINNLTDKQPNVLLSSINAVLGTDFLFNFRDNDNTHPLAQLVTFGRVLLERTARNLLTGSAIAASGGIIGIGNDDVGSALRKISSFFMVIASIMFSAGFMLFYVLPLLPFVYFFFAMLSWVKAIFEALIGAPLWALAHLRVEGNGFPSGPARAGYLLLLEIFLRPIVTVFALLAAMGIYTAVVYFLNDTLGFMLMIMGRKNLADVVGDHQNIGDIRGLVDVFFFTIMYILLVYMLANSCFQIIDKIPNGFMNRWFGQGAKSFAQVTYAHDSPAKNFTSYTFIAAANPASSIISKVGDLTAGAASAAAEAMNKASGGQLRSTIQRAVGKDRSTKINEAIEEELGEMISTSYKATKTAEHAEKQAIKFKKDADAATDPQEKARLADQAKAWKDKAEYDKITAQINDPELLMKELREQGSSGMSVEAVMRARQEGKFDALTKTREKTWSLMGDLQQSRVEASGGFYAENEMVQSGLAASIKQTKQSIFARLRQKEKGE